MSTLPIMGSMLTPEKKIEVKRRKAHIDQNVRVTYRNHKTSSEMVRFVKSLHDNIFQTISDFYQCIMRSYHGTMPSFKSFRLIFHFQILGTL